MSREAERVLGEMRRLQATLAGKSFAEQLLILAKIQDLGMERKRLVELEEAE